MNSNIIVWLDLETTGLNPEVDKILEIGIVITDWNLGLIEKYNWVISHVISSINLLMVPFVKKMHTENNLLEEVSKSNLDLDRVEFDIVKILLPYVQKSTHFVIGGNSVHFDKQFIDKHMKVLSYFLHYRIIDISVLNILSEKWTPRISDKIKEKEENGESKKPKEDEPKPKPNENNKHRVLFDLDNCLKSAIKYKELLFREI